MGLQKSGIDIASGKYVDHNGIAVKEVQHNGITVWKKELVLYENAQWGSLGFAEQAKAEGYSDLHNSFSGANWSMGCTGRADFVFQHAIQGYTRFNVRMPWRARWTNEGAVFIGAHATRPMTWGDPWVWQCTYMASANGDSASSYDLSVAIPANTTLFFGVEALFYDTLISKIWLD